jgi:pyrroline-5-carboxylate reductase
MATALTLGFVRAELLRPDNITAADPSQEARQRFSKLTGVETTLDNIAVVKQSEILFLAVKPQQIIAVATQIRPHLTPKHLVISIAAGVNMKTLAELLGPATRLARVVPNTPCLVGQGACAFAFFQPAGLADAAGDDDRQLVKQLLESVGTATLVDEKLLDPVTGLSGSGPAFVYIMIEAMSDGGVRMGLPRSMATALAAQTVLGAAQMVLATGEHPAVLKDRVASPGGTTIAGLQALETGGVRAALMAAVEAATRRSLELAKG